MFDDCKGEKIQDLLALFSTVVLRKVMATGQIGRASIASQLALAKTVTSKQHESLLPLAIAHRASLTAVLHRKAELRNRYREFGQTMNVKESQLDQTFEAVVSTQNLLDQHIIADHTVARTKALFEKNWKGNHDIRDVITKGDELEQEDSFLDKPFDETWNRISHGKKVKKSEIVSLNLLVDLEKRVKEQQTRLKQWKDFKEVMKREIKLKESPKRQDIGLNRTQSKEQDIQKCKERDIVFSPRKSPRKSGWGLANSAIVMSPAPFIPAMCDNKELPLQLVDGLHHNGKKDLPPLIHPEAKAPNPESPMSSHSGSLDSTDELDLSEISGGQLNHDETSQQSAKALLAQDPSPSIRPFLLPKHQNRDDAPEFVKDEANTILQTNHNPHPEIVSAPKIQDSGKSLPDDVSNLEPCIKTELQPQDDDETLGQQINSMTINATPTPTKLSLSLAERTRQSMAFAAPSGFQGLTAHIASPSPTISIAAKNKSNYVDNGTTNTLIERTRQSILMLPPQPKASRKSLLNRRDSRLYPTNQLETPKKQLSMVEEVTPPEVLFSPGAGYDSVFKSRPKIAVSPTPSPVLDGHVGMDKRYEDESLGDSADGMHSSPLAKITTRV